MLMGAYALLLLSTHGVAGALNMAMHLLQENQEHIPHWKSIAHCLVSERLSE
jgi:hypothetical protein